MIKMARYSGALRLRFQSLLGSRDISLALDTTFHVPRTSCAYCGRDFCPLNTMSAASLTANSAPSMNLEVRFKEGQRGAVTGLSLDAKASGIEEKSRDKALLNPPYGAIDRNGLFPQWIGFQ